jgi:hypothetical protein
VRSRQLLPHPGPGPRRRHGWPGWLAAARRRWAWIEEAASARRPAAAHVADALRDRIARGELRPGDQLPGVNALARRLSVGPKTVAQALAELRAEGLVSGGVGRGRCAKVASTLPSGLAGCIACGRAIAVGDEHYPHRPHCTMAARGWCDCDEAAHPECCPTCASGATA